MVKNLQSLDSVLTGRFSKSEMIQFVLDQPHTFNLLVEISLADEKPQSWRAAYLLNHLLQPNDHRIREKIDEYIQELDKKDGGQKREILKILSKMELDEEQEGRLYQKCQFIWERIDNQGSIRITAFKFMIQLAVKYPELFEELSLLTQDHYVKPLSNGFSASLKILRKKYKF